MRNDNKLGLQIIKLTFFLISYAVIYAFEGINKTAYISLFVFIITAWIDCMNAPEVSHTYKGRVLNKIEENTKKYEIIGSLLGILLVPVCFILMIKVVANGSNENIPPVYNYFFWICYMLSFIFALLKIFTVLYLLFVRKDKIR